MEPVNDTAEELLRVLLSAALRDTHKGGMSGHPSDGVYTGGHSPEGIL